MVIFQICVPMLIVFKWKKMKKNHSYANCSKQILMYTLRWSLLTAVISLLLLKRGRYLPIFFSDQTGFVIPALAIITQTISQSNWSKLQKLTQAKVPFIYYVSTHREGVSFFLITKNNYTKFLVNTTFGHGKKYC